MANEWWDDAGVTKRAAQSVQAAMIDVVLFMVAPI
jgi:hypothetical protein